jgi:hypothetical protein
MAPLISEVAMFSCGGDAALLDGIVTVLREFDITSSVPGWQRCDSPICWSREIKGRK